MLVRSRLLHVTVAALLLGTMLLTGCAPATETEDDQTDAQASAPAALKIGTLATQDALPLWVAEDAGYFADNGLTDVEIITFQSAQESQAAFTAGAVDALMTDIIVAANLHGSGTEVMIATVMLGADTGQGRFAIVAAPGSTAQSIANLAGVPVGTASATITEYVLDRLMDAAGVPAADIAKEEVDKVPVRFELLMAGQLQAASLPEPFVTLAEQGGATVVAGGDDTQASENISQSVLCVNAEYAESAAGAAAVEAALKAWDAAVADINADPDSYRATLVSKARLPEPLANTYQVSEYPQATPPSADDIQRVLDWMATKGYLQVDVTPQDLLGTR